MDEDILIAPWIGSTCCKNTISIAVLSSNGDIIETLSEALIDVQARRNCNWKLTILRSFSLESIVRQSNLTGKLGMDFVIVAMDTSRIFCLEWAQKIIDQVHPDLRFRRVVLLNASGLPINAMAVNASDIMSFCSENRLDMLNSNVCNKEEAHLIARKLLRYIEVSIGTQTGIPNLNV